MRSLIILEVGHDENTDGLQMFAEWCQRRSRRPLWEDIDVTGYSVKVDVPESKVDSDELILNEFMFWLRREGWIKDDLLNQAVDITVSDFMHERRG